MKTTHLPATTSKVCSPTKHVALLLTAITVAFTSPSVWADGSSSHGGTSTSVPLSVLAANDPLPPPVLPSGTLTRTIRATPEAQRWFDQGLRTFYGFNHRESYRAFRYGAQLDPDSVMCLWGAALSLGVNLNQTDQPPADRVAALAYLDRALQVQNPDPTELALVQSLRLRYLEYPEMGDEADRQMKRNVAYADAMTSLAADHELDADVQTLYVDSVMNLQPWKYWNLDGSPHCEPGAPICGRLLPALATLEQGLARQPTHMGLVHWYIHLLEGSSTPEKAKPYADTLGALGQDSGHLIHMPAHIYSRIGDHLSSVAVNDAAYQADLRYFANVPLSHPEGDRFAYGYRRHNVHFMLASAIMCGRMDALQLSSAYLLETENTNVRYRTDRYRGIYYPGLTYFLTPAQILATQPPPSSQPDVWGFATASWYYARTLAYVRQGAGHIGKAVSTLQQLKHAQKAYIQANPTQSGNIAVLETMVRVAGARVLELQGKRNEGLLLLAQAIQMQEDMDYDDPPYWMVPVLQTQAALLIKAGRYSEALSALRTSLNHGVTDKNLYSNFLGNGWAYFGIKTIYEQRPPRTAAELQELATALSILSQYCPTGTECVFSLERM